MSPFSLIPGPPGAQLCGAAGGDVLAPKPLHGQLQHLCRLQWASPAVSFWKVFQRGVWRPASRSFPPPWKFPTMKLLKPPVALLPPHLVMKDSSLVARQGTEQLRSQNETCREFSKERLPNRTQGIPFWNPGSLSGRDFQLLWARSQAPPEPRNSSCCQCLGGVGRVHRALHIFDAQ